MSQNETYSNGGCLLAKADSFALTMQEWMSSEHLVLHLDATSSALILPDWLKAADTTSIKLSRNMQLQAVATATGLAVDLIICRQRHACFIPFDSVWGVMNAECFSQVWIANAPQSVKSRLEEIQAAGVKEKKILNVFLGLELIP